MNNNSSAFAISYGNLSESNLYNDYPPQYPYSQVSTPILNPEFRKRRNVTFLTYSFLFVTAPIFLIIYAVLWSQIQPPLNLVQTGNAWTFILFLVTCVVIMLSALIIVILCKTKYPLRYKHVVGFDLLVVVCYTGLLMVAIGAMEQVMDRNKCNKNGIQCSKHYAPKVPTTFGIYVAGVCGKNLTELDLPGAAPVIPQMPKDSVKCEATKVLKIEIYCMYIWTGIVMVVSIVEMLFGLGNWRNKDIPEFI